MQSPKIEDPKKRVTVNSSTSNSSYNKFKNFLYNTVKTAQVNYHSKTSMNLKDKYFFGQVKDRDTKTMLLHNKYINKKCQKIVINPGVPYISTSNDGVFELRNKRAAMKVGKQTNKFIALPKNNEDPDFNGTAEEVYLFTIKPVFDAHQLKCQYIP